MMNEAVGYFSDAKCILFRRLLRSPSVAPASIGKVRQRAKLWALMPPREDATLQVLEVNDQTFR